MYKNFSLVKDVISGIETSIKNDVFLDYENQLIELKDLSSGQEWVSLKESICAFLNTNGGYVICGVRERNKKYHLTGFDRNTEGKLIDIQTKFFKNDNDVYINLSYNILLDYHNILDKTIAVITILPLSEDLKFLKFNEVYYERILARDVVISESRLRLHKEYKTELEYSKEITTVPNSNLEDLDIDKINQFIIKINATGKKETVKKDLNDAIDFLNRKYCIKQDHSITVLGLLLFGKEPSRYLENRARVDCYFETGNSIGRDKLFLDNDILNLMDDAFAFVWGHIKVGRTALGGGNSLPEFPEELIREIVNNALAHRDYTINKFITIKINPGKNIEVENPGTFKQKMLKIDSSTQNEIRRIIPGVAESKNPKLANELKAFEKIESQGIGMATLVSACLNNQIDVPYYDLSIPDKISLIVPSGKLLDEETERWINSFNGYINDRLGFKASLEHLLVLAYLYKSEKINQKRNYTILLSPSNNHFDVLNDLKESRLISEHLSASNEQTPIYTLNPELIITDYSKRIENQTGIIIDSFSIDHKQVINIIYRYNHFNKQSIKANLITPELYNLKYGKEIKPTLYESLGRRVRQICSDYLKSGVLSKNKDKSYQIVTSSHE